MNFLGNVIKEMRKMRWAKSKEVIEGTVSVIMVAAFVMAFYLFADMGILSIKNIWSGIFN